LNGKKIPKITGNSSVNIKNEAILAFAGLTWDDVQAVDLSSYGGQGDALIQGQIDVVSTTPTASMMFEADSKTGIRWLEMDPNDTEGWKRLQEVAPWVFSETRDDGAGIKEDTPLIGYGYPVASYANQETDMVYELVKAFDENFEQYKDATPS